MKPCNFASRATYLTLLRDPTECFESNYVYMGLQSAFGMDINQFAKRKAAPGIRRRPNAVIGKNQMLWDLGLDHFDMEDVQRVKSFIGCVLQDDHFAKGTRFCSL